mmetsp:Transcript_12356/g.24008  ORF Transcript_12356/g.24008 Transcript_12356/m.24008 type:complete len:237 (+) Transcript_12356:758-1468(+)
MKPPGAIVISKIVSQARVMVPKAPHKYSLDCKSRSISVIAICRYCAKKIAAMISNKKRRIMDQRSAPIELDTAVTSTRRGLKAFMKRTSLNTFINRSNLKTRRVEIPKAPSSEEEMNHESRQLRKTTMASKKFILLYKYHLPTAMCLNISSSRKKPANIFSVTLRSASNSGIFSAPPDGFVFRPSYWTRKTITTMLTRINKPIHMSNDPLLTKAFHFTVSTESAISSRKRSSSSTF